MIGAGIAGSRLFRDSDEQQKVLELTALFGIFFFGNWCIAKLERSISYAVRRFASLLLTSAVTGISIYLFMSHTLYVRYTVAIYYVLASGNFHLYVVFF